MIRTELRVENTVGEWAVTIEAPEDVSPQESVGIAVKTLGQIMDVPFILPHQR